MDSGQARTVATHCAWRTARAGRSAYHDCSTLPIFASGNDVTSATLHDAEALDVHPPWVHLNRGTPEKEWWKDNRCKALPDPALPHSDFPSNEFQCDEYPFLSTDQGGGTAAPAPHLKKIDADDNQHQGSLLGSFFTLCHLNPKGSGKPFLAIPLVGIAPDGSRSVLPVATRTRLCNGI
jgi:hypothetical protein